MLRADWSDSLLGRTAMENVLYVETFREMARRLSPQPWGLFLLEGQSWEMALTAAWRRQGTRTLGYCHSSVRPLDLRLFSGPRAFSPREQEFRPGPDRFVVGGSGAERILRDAGVPPEKITVAEATRYGYLADRHGSARKLLPSAGRVLLVLTGYQAGETRYQIRLLNAAARLEGLASYGKVLVKCHPFMPLTRAGAVLVLPIPHEVTAKPVKDLLEMADVVFCANGSTTALESAWLGLPTICSGIDDEFTLNPLLGVPGAVFVDTPEALKESLERPGIVDIPPDFLRLDSGLPAWRRLLADEWD